MCDFFLRLPGFFLEARDFFLSPIRLTLCLCRGFFSADKFFLEGIDFASRFGRFLFCLGKFTLISIDDPLCLCRLVLKADRFPLQVSDLALRLGGFVDITLDLTAELFSSGLGFKKFVSYVGGGQNSGICAANFAGGQDLLHFFSHISANLVHISGGFFGDKGVFCAADRNGHMVRHRIRTSL